MSSTQIGFAVALFITGLLALTFVGAESTGERVKFVGASLVMAVILGAGLGLLPQG